MSQYEVARAWIDGYLPDGQTWQTVVSRPPPWVTAKTGPVADVVREARACERAAERAAEHGDDEQARAWLRFSRACWVWSVIAILEGRAFTGAMDGGARPDR